MGRFDALTQIEEKPQRSAPSPVTSSPAVNNLQSQPIKKQVEAEKKPANPKARKPQNPLARKPEKGLTNRRRLLNNRGVLNEKTVKEQSV